MKIKYIKDAPQGKKGDVKDVSDFNGNILIKSGFAEQYTAPKRIKKTASTDDSE